MATKRTQDPIPASEVPSSKRRKLQPTTTEQNSSHSSTDASLDLFRISPAVKEALSKGYGISTLGPSQVYDYRVTCIFVYLVSVFVIRRPS